MAGLPIGRGIRKAELNLHLGSQPGEVLLALVFALAAVQVVELFAGSCQLALQLCGLLSLFSHGFGGAFCCNGLLNLNRERLLVVAFLLTQAGQLLVEQSDNFLVLILGHGHTPFLVQVVYALVQLLHKGVILLIGFDLTGLLVQIVERFLELAGRFGGAFGGLAVTHEPGVQGPQSLTNAHDNQPDAGAHYGSLNCHHRGAGNSGHGRPCYRPSYLEPGKRGGHGRFEPGKRGPESSHEGGERKPLDSVAQRDQLSPEGHSAGDGCLGVAHIHEHGSSRRCNDCFRTTKHRYQLPDAGDNGRNDSHGSLKGSGQHLRELLHAWSDRIQVGCQFTQHRKNCGIDRSTHLHSQRRKAVCEGTQSTRKGLGLQLGHVLQQAPGTG